jgi:small subunit ribosomal protein S5
LAQEAVKVGIQGEQPLEDTVVKVFRSAKVVKGGRRFSFASLVVVGDRSGTVGIGYGKANEVPPAVEKAIKDAKKNLHNITLVDGTLPHKIVGKCRATSITMVPASPGTGVIAGSSARAVLEASPGTGVIAGSSARAVLEYAGVRNVLTKINGSTSAKNVVKAVMNGLLKLRDKEAVESLRGVKIEAVKRW